jgi:hypothetical protein
MTLLEVALRERERSNTRVYTPFTRNVLIYIRGGVIYSRTYTLIAYTYNKLLPPYPATPVGYVFEAPPQPPLVPIGFVVTVGGGVLSQLPAPYQSIPVYGEKLSPNQMTDTLLNTIIQQLQQIQQELQTSKLPQLIIMAYTISGQTTPTPLLAGHVIVKRVTVKADDNNTGRVWLGVQGVAPKFGFPLAPSQAKDFGAPTYAGGVDLSTIFIVFENTTDTAEIIYEQ